MTRGLRAAQLAYAAGALLALVAAGRPWLHVVVPRDRPLADAVVTISGRTVAPLVTAVAIAVIGGAVGLFATRGLGRVALGAVVTLLGVALLAASLPHLAAAPATAVEGWLTQPLAGRDPTRPLLSRSLWWWPALAATGGALVAVAGVATALRGRRWSGMSNRFERAGAAGGGAAPGAGGAEAGSGQRAVAAWDALDRGDDPTL